MLVNTHQLFEGSVDRAKESWIEEALELMPEAPSQDSYKWLFETFRATVAANPTARAVHFNYARYQGTKRPLTERGKLFEIIDWIESQVDDPGFDWNNLLMQFSILANA